jgi:DNA-binding transcriptional LysR family regulator
MQDNEDDLYVISQPPEDLDLSSQPFLDNPLVVIARRDHPNGWALPVADPGAASDLGFSPDAAPSAGGFRRKIDRTAPAR